jgi:mannitol-specific phosphotransferase system IIBC component
VEKHVTVLGILFIAYSAVGLATGLLVFFVLFGAGTIAELSPGADAPLEVLPILVTIGSLICGFFLVSSIPGIIAGIGLLKFKPWSRILTLVLSIIYLLEVPLGTALGIYGLWVLFNQETAKLFAVTAPPKGATPPSQ